jgi:spore maturation protein CgeB
MVNNRVFEALSCGAAVLTDAFPALETVFGDTVGHY